MSPVSPLAIVPAVWLNWSQIDGPRPPSWTAPSIWYAAVAAPHTQSSGKITPVAAMPGVSQTNGSSMSHGGRRCGCEAGRRSLRSYLLAERQLLLHLLDCLLVWRLGDGMDVPGHEVHVGLEDLR